MITAFARRRTVQVIAGMAAVTALSSAYALPPSSDIKAALQASPLLQSAEAQQAGLLAAAKQLRLGTYELQLQGGIGEREVDVLGAEQDFEEWNVQVTRPVRLPRKALIDRKVASLEEERAALGYEAAYREAQVTFANQWADLRRASLQAKTAGILAETAQNLAARAAQAVDLGAGRAVSAEQLAVSAELAAVEAQNFALEVAAARQQLAASFPTLSIPTDPPPLAWDERRIGRLLTVEGGPMPSVEAKALSTERLQLEERRARLDRLPDPTLGFLVSNEFSGQETAYMATLSVPLGGRARAAAADQARAARRVGAASLALMERDTVRRYELARRRALAAKENLPRLRAARATSRKAMERYRMGREVGAVSLQDIALMQNNQYANEKMLIERLTEAERALLVFAAMHGQLTEDFD